MTRRTVSGAERGLVLPVALIVLLLLGALAMALVTLAGLEPAIARNLADAMRARLLAEAGLERARGLLVATADWTDLLAAGDGDDALLLDTTALPGRGAHEGTHAVRVRNDFQAGDTGLTGMAPDVGGRAADTNDHLVVASTGRAGRARRTVLAVARRLPLPVPPAAVALTGPGPGLALGGDRVEIDGRDHDADGRPGSCSPAWAIAVAGPGAEEAVEAAVSPALASRLQGRAQDESIAGAGPNTIAPDAGLEAAAVTRFVETVRGRADVVLDAGQGAVAMTSVGQGCALDPPGEDCWGTAERPRVVVVTGPAPGDGIPVLDLSGRSEGHGVLVVDSGAARVSGDFHWRGLIIVTGRGAGLEFAGGGDQTVLGGLVIDQPPGDVTSRGLVAGEARLLRSCTAMEQASRAPRLVTLHGWQEVPLY